MFSEEPLIIFYVVIGQLFEHSRFVFAHLSDLN